MAMRRFSVTATTNGSGAATVYTPIISGRLNAIHYVKDGTVPFDDGVDFTITAEATGETLWAESNVNASASRYPRVATNTPVAGLTGAFEEIGIAADRAKIVVAQGGASKAGAFVFFIEG